MDVRMPGMDGLEATKLIKEKVPETAVLIFTAYSERSLLGRGLESGAKGYILKEAPHATLLRAIEKVAGGEGYVDPALMPEFLTGSHAAPSQSHRALRTVVFTDIEKSTDLAVSLGDAVWFGVLREHQRLVGAQAEANGGRIVQSMGDGFMLCFRSARQASFCFQSALARESSSRWSAVVVGMAEPRSVTAPLWRSPSGGSSARSVRRSLAWSSDSIRSP